MNTLDLVYLDNNATTQPAPEAIEAMQPYLREWWGNPSSVHRFGQHARQGVDTARAQIAQLIGCADAELMFTGCGTESINTAVHSLLASRAPRNRLVTSTVEHAAMHELAAELQKSGVQVVEIGVDSSGALDMDQLEASIDDQTALVSIMYANNETGVLFPVDKIAKLCRERRVPFHCDATQAVGKIAINVKELGIDVMSFAGHKFHGIKGVGGLFVRRGMRMRPLLIGGPQERNRRGGTENVPGIVGTGKAAELAQSHLGEMAKVAALRDKLEKGILSNIPETGVNGSTEHRVPNTTNISFSRLEAEAILLLLSEQGIAASAGSACSSGSLEPSHVLQAMHLDKSIAHGAIRFSLSRYTTEQEIDRALEVLPGIIDRLRAVLPIGA